VLVHPMETPTFFLPVVQCKYHTGTPRGTTMLAETACQLPEVYAHDDPPNDDPKVKAQVQIVLGVRGLGPSGV
jgi:hypothetical protein